MDLTTMAEVNPSERVQCGCFAIEGTLNGGRKPEGQRFNGSR